MVGLAHKSYGGQVEPGRQPACVSCVVVEADASALQDAPSSTDVPVPLAVRVRPGVTLPATVLRRVDAVIVEPAAPLAPPEVDGAETQARAVFALRTLITSLRVARSDVVIAADAEAFARAGVPLDPLEAYVDAVIGRGWRRVVLPSPRLDDLVAASLIPAAERVVVAVDAVDWALMREFARYGASTVQVVAGRALTAAEIVARHQARRRNDEEYVQSSIAQGTTTLMFEVPGMTAPVTVTAETRVFRRADLTDLEQRDIRINGAAIAGGGGSSAPHLPLLEPERIGTPPLTMALTDAYEYALDGEDTLDGRRTYLVAFRPRVVRGTVARGRAWIDASDFALRRLQSIQSGLRGPIVSAEQVDDFGRFTVNGVEISLPIRSQVFQTYEGAGHRTPIHRLVALPRYVLNPADFDAQLTAAYDSPHVMLRETSEGLRYLLRNPSAARGETRRVAANAGREVRALVFGVLVDPGITRPLPFAGLSYVNMNLFDRGAQLNIFLGGTYGQLSWSIPSIAGSGWQLHGSAFAIAARYNDRAFRDGVEQYRENIRQRPAHASLALVKSMTARVRARLEYQLDVTGFSRAETTSPAFVVPATAIVHGALASVDVERGAWTLRSWGNPAWRENWRAWGAADPRQGPIRGFVRYGASATRTLALRPHLVSRIEAAWVDGTRLDRFSRYGFDGFTNRLHGYPSASIRYDRGAVVRSTTTWTGRGWRLDGFADLALVHDPGLGRELRRYPGIGGAIEAAGPLRTLWSVEWGYGINARASSGQTGTHTIRISGYRAF